MSTAVASAAPSASKRARQGDVFLIRVDEIPELEVKKTYQGSIVLAQGTAAGNRHMIEGKVTMVELADESRFVTVEEEANFFHAEHRPGIAMAPGIYRLKIQGEYVDGSYRDVMD